VRVESPGALGLEAAGFSRRSARLFARRGATTPEAVRDFLAPSLAALHPAAGLLGLEPAVERLAAAHARGEKVAIVGDYDVDGITATALLAATLRSSGLEVETILPRRDAEGYGFQPVHVERAAAASCTLLVTVDCGMQGFAGAETAARRGLDLIVTDHHLPGEELPGSALVINPRQPGCGYPFRDLTGAGLALKLAAAHLERAGRSVPWSALLRVACLGTIADVAPLVGENRAIAALGLAALASARSPGLRALLESAGVQPPVRSVDVGFRIGPRLNAAGRLDSPEPALEVLLTRDRQRAGELVRLLDGHNRRRQQLEAAILVDARAEIASRPELPPIVVAWREGWHRGIVGIAAGRLARELHRPVLLLAVDGARATGSGRSVPGLSLHDFLRPWADRMERFGGHDQAIGLTVRLDRMDGLRSDLEAAAAEWEAELLRPRHGYDDELDAAEIDEELETAVRELEPFGLGNPEPLFRVGPLRLAGDLRPFGNGHLGLRARGADGGPEVDLLGWGWAGRAIDWSSPFEILAHLDRDRYRDEAVLRLVDARAMQSGGAN
jgi:single-stranded-DNA-specific exonuclease